MTILSKDVLYEVLERLDGLHPESSVQSGVHVEIVSQDLILGIDFQLFKCQPAVLVVLQNILENCLVEVLDVIMVVEVLQG